MCIVQCVQCVFYIVQSVQFVLYRVCSVNVTSKSGVNKEDLIIKSYLILSNIFLNYRNPRHNFNIKWVHIFFEERRSVLFICYVYCV